MNNYKQSKKHKVLFGFGIFFIIGAIIMITEDITATITFGILAIIFLYLGRKTILDIKNNRKLEKLKNEKFQEQLKIENELNLEKIKIQKDIELKKMQLEHEQLITQLQLENQKQLSLNGKLSDIDSLPDGYAFEEYTAELLKKLGYINVSVTSSSNDYGIDVLAEKDNIKYAIQCKFYSQPVGNKAVQEAFSGKQYYNAHVAVVLTNNVFTENAKNLAKNTGVLLWDKDILQNMIDNAYNNTLNNYKNFN